MTTQKDTSLTVDRLTPSHAYLFDNELDGAMDEGGELDLPFMRDWKEKHLAWWTPDFKGDTEKASAYGYRSAAAWFIAVTQRGGDVVNRASLEQICQDFLKANTEEDEVKAVAGFSFTFYLTRLLWSYGQQISPAAIVRDVEATIAQQNRFGASNASAERAA